VSGSRIRFAYLGSGSRGNSALIESDGTCIMIDCGFSVAATEARLARLGRSAEDVDAILVTHEHSDHIGGVARLARRHRIAVWMTPGTWSAAPDRDIPEPHLFNCHENFEISGLLVEPMPVPHDAREPCQFVVSDGARRLGILTDSGHVTRHIVTTLSSCDALVVECNHDLDMLMRGPYPAAVKQRVAGELGHLNNEQAAELVAQIDVGRLQHLVAVHISDTNNTRELAIDSLAAALDVCGDEIEAACQNEGLSWREVV
jgi:phosphoribosyl 1,2-cyclic phosphodiesterase